MAAESSFKKSFKITAERVQAHKQAYLDRRPHRSFRRTLRRDYVRSLQFPGYFSFTFEVARTIGKNWRTFIIFFVLYALLSSLVLGIISQANYSEVTSAFKQSGAGNNWLQSLVLFGSAITGGLNPQLSESQQVYSGLLILLGWLVMVWLLRHLLAEQTVRVRDGLYNAGAPLISTFLVACVGIFQALPLVLVAIGYNAAVSTNFLSGGIEAMLFFGVAALLVLLSLYWLTSTFIALIVVTLPGVYPLQALRASGDLVVGRRLRLILRLLWLLLSVLVLWAVILIPIILLDNWINVSWLPLVPIFVLLLSTATLMWSSAYIYLMYRKLVDDDAKPAL